MVCVGIVVETVVYSVACHYGEERLTFYCYKYALCVPILKMGYECGLSYVYAYNVLQ